MAKRKPIPVPIETPAERGLAPRVLQPQQPRRTAGSVLPTAAALALALAGLGCSTASEGITPDLPTTKSAAVSTTTASAAPTTTASEKPGRVDPTPVAMPGEPAMVVPTPTPHKPVGPAPSAKKLAGKPMIVHGPGDTI